MANKKIYKKFSEVEPLLKSSKHAKLQDVNHKDIIPFNQPKKPVKPKILEIKKKLETLPDGIYCVVAQDRFGHGVHQDRYYIGKGHFDGSELSEEPERRSRRSSSDDSEDRNLLSLNSAVDHIKTAADLKADNRFLERENEKLKEEVRDLKQEVRDLKAEVQTLRDANEELAASEGEEENTFLKGLTPFLSELTPVLPSLADRYFTMKEKQDETKRVELLLKHGYDVPGAKRNGRAPGAKKKAAMPVPGTPEWEQYVEEVKSLDDDKFNEHMALIEEKFPSIYDALYADVMEEEEEEEP